MKAISVEIKFLEFDHMKVLVVLPARVRPDYSFQRQRGCGSRQNSLYFIMKQSSKLTSIILIATLKTRAFAQDRPTFIYIYTYRDKAECCGLLKTMQNMSIF